MLNSTLTSKEPIAGCWAQACAAGSSGELVQGVVRGVDFHISCPIDVYSRAQARILAQSEVRVPVGKTKVQAIVRKVLHMLGCESYGAQVTIASELLCAKGMASSTADIAAAAGAVSAALGQRLSPQTIAEMALEIEPTDGTIFPGSVLFDHRRGRRLEFLGQPPRLELLLLDTGGTVSTLSLEGNRSPYSRQEESLIEEAACLVKEGLKQGAERLIGLGATISARVNEMRLPKGELEHVISTSSRAGAVGVNVAHSGTLLGIICPPGGGHHVYQRLEMRLKARVFRLASMVGGGVFYQS